MELYLVRHTAPDINEGICYGQSDIDVMNSFAHELAALKRKIDGIQPTMIYSSPLQRCAKLAGALQLGSVIHDDRLKELNFGDWELKTWDDIPRPVFDAWANDYANLSPPNGETFSQLHVRATAFLRDCKRHTAGDSVMVVTHGGVIRALLAEVLNIPLKGLFRFRIDYASVTQLVLDEAVPRLGYVNR